MENTCLKSGTVLQGATYTYTIEKILGQGSFGITYLASTTVKVEGSLGTFDSTIRVAIKEFFMRDINGRVESTVTSGTKGGIYDHYRRKFAREAQNLSKLRHPHIIRVLEAFEANNTVYYAMEYCEGGSLDDRIVRSKGLTEQESVEYTRQIGAALSYMHSQKVLHLDLKPSNVMLRGDGSLVLIDFGLSKQYDESGAPESSTTIGGGTPGYAPLEQANYREGGQFQQTIDVYSLGATLYKMLTGKRPPEATDIFNDGFPYGELRQRGVSAALTACVERAMSSAKRDRYQSVDELMAALDGLSTEADIEATVVEEPIEVTVVDGPARRRQPVHPADREDEPKIMPVLKSGSAKPNSPEEPEEISDEVPRRPIKEVYGGMAVASYLFIALSVIYGLVMVIVKKSEGDEDLAAFAFMLGMPALIFELIIWGKVRRALKQMEAPQLPMVMMMVLVTLCNILEFIGAICGDWEVQAMVLVLVTSQPSLVLIILSFVSAHRLKSDARVKGLGTIFHVVPILLIGGVLFSLLVMIGEYEVGCVLLWLVNCLLTTILYCGFARMFTSKKILVKSE